MKKHLTKMMSAASAILLAASASGVLHVSAANIQRNGYRIGDLDGDKAVTIDDALSALEIYTASVMGHTEKTSVADKAADIDNNGSIDIDDALSILQYYSGSLLGQTRLWADIRPVTNVDSTKYRTGDGAPWTLSDMYLEIGCAAGAPGEEVTVPVYIAGAAKLAGFQYYQYVPESFELTKIESPTFNAENGKVLFNTDAEVYDIAFSDPANDQDYSLSYRSSAMIFVGSGGKNVDVSDGAILAYYTYKIPEDAVSGSFYPLSAEVNDGLFVTENQEAYNYTLIDGIILVK